MVARCNAWVAALFFVEFLVARESFLLRTDPKVLEALRRWAEDELRSANGQLDFILRRALKDAGRLPAKARRSPPTAEPGDEPAD